MMNSCEPEPFKYRSARHAFAEIIMNEGIMALFNGAGFNILRAISGTCAIAVYDGLQLTLFGEALSSV